VQAELNARPTAAALAAAAGSAAIGYIAPGTGASFRNVQAKLQEASPTVTDYYSANDAGDYTPAFVRAFNYLYSTRTNHPTFNGMGVGDLILPRGEFPLNTSLTFPDPQYSFGIRGAGRLASVISKNITTGNALYFNPSGYLPLTDFALINESTAPGDSTAIAMLGTNGAHIVSVQRVQLRDFWYGFSLLGVTNGDFIHFDQVEFSTWVGFTNNANKNAVAVSFHGVSFGCGEAVLDLGGAGDTTLRDSGGNIYKTYLKLREGAGIANVYPQVVCTENTKLEYQGGITGYNDRLLVDGRACLLSPNSGGADSDILFKNVTYVMGQNPPGHPGTAAYDTHPVITLAGGRHRVNMVGGYIRGAVSYASNYIETSARWSFRYMRAAPLPSGVTLTGTGTYSHPLMEWRACENVPIDQYRGGQAMNASTDARKIYHWHSVATSLINTGVSTTPLGGRIGANFTITGFPAYTAQDGLVVFIRETLTGVDLEITQYTDNTFTTAVGQTRALPAGTTPGRYRVHAIERNMPASGEVYVRITAQATGHIVAGGLGIEYCPYMVS
jgi:hypothetical protein